MEKLTNEQLCALAKVGDEEAKAILCENNKGLVYQKALSVQERNKALNIEKEDLVMAGYEALLKAIPLYDESHGCTFTAYAGAAIEKSLASFVDNVNRQFENRAQKDGITFVSLYERLSHEERTPCIQIIPDEFAKSPEQVYMESERRKLAEAASTAVEELSPRQRKYIHFRFGFDEEDAQRPLTVTADHFHLSEERARQIEREAKRNVRKKLPH